MFHLLVTGDRNWSSKSVVSYVLQFFDPTQTTVMHGWARGLDTYVDEVGHELQMTVVRRPAHWRHDEQKWVSVHGNCPPFCKEVCGRPAGVIRNGAMLVEHRPQLLLAFHNNLVESRGTKDMVARAEKLHVPTILVTEQNYPKITRSTIDKVLHNAVSFFSF